MFAETCTLLAWLVLFDSLTVGYSGLTSRRPGDLESQKIVSSPNELGITECRKIRPEFSSPSDIDFDEDYDLHRCHSDGHYRCHDVEDIELLLEEYEHESSSSDITTNIPQITELMFQGIKANDLEQFYHVVADKSGPIKVRQTLKGKYIDVYTEAERMLKGKDARQLVSLISQPALSMTLGKKSEEMKESLQSNYESLMAVTSYSRDLVFKMFQAKVKGKDDGVFEYIVTGFDTKDKTIGVAYGFKSIDVKDPRDLFNKLVDAIAKAQSVNLPTQEHPQGSASLINVQYSPMQFDGDAHFHRARTNENVFGNYYRHFHFDNWVKTVNNDELDTLRRQADNVIKKVKGEAPRLAAKLGKTVAYVNMEQSHDAKRKAIKEVKASLMETAEAAIYGKGHAPTTPEMRELLPSLNVNTAMPRSANETFTLREYVVEILDQRSSNLCTICAATAAVKMLEPLLTGAIDANSFLTKTAMMEYGGRDGLTIPEAIASVTNVTGGMGLHFEGAHVEPQYSAIRRILKAGVPVIGGFKLPNEIESPLNEPLSSTETSMSIHHSMLIVGYDDEKQEYEVLNAWGTRWRNQGFASISVTSGYLMEAWLVAPINSKIGKKMKSIRESMLPGSESFGSVIHSWRERIGHFRPMKLAIKAAYQALEVHRTFPLHRCTRGRVTPGPIVSIVEGALARASKMSRERLKANRPNCFIKIFPEEDAGEKYVLERLVHILSVGLSDIAPIYDILDGTEGHLENDGMKHGALMWARIHRVLERTSKTMSYGAMRMDELNQPILEGGGILFDDSTAKGAAEIAAHLMSFGRLETQPFIAVEAKKDCSDQVVRVSAMWSRLDGSYYDADTNSHSVAFIHADISEEEWRVIVTDEELKKIKAPVLGPVM